jgi:hypothetical protein
MTSMGLNDADPAYAADPWGGADTSPGTHPPELIYLVVLQPLLSS